MRSKTLIAAGLLSLSAAASQPPADRPKDSQIARLMELLEAPAAAERYRASRELAKLGAPAIPDLLVGLKSARPLLRAMSAHALSGMEVRAEAALPQLATTLEGDSDAEVRMSCARAIGLIGRSSPLRPRLVSVLRVALKDKVERTRIHAAFALAALEPTATEAARELGLALTRPEEEDGATHQEACFRLADMGPAAAVAVPQLIGLLKGSDPDLRWPAIEALEKIGPAAAASLPQLKLLATRGKGDHEMTAAKKAIAAIEGARPRPPKR